MRRIIIFVVISVFSLHANCQNSNYNIQELSDLCKVWGIYKYFSPATNIDNTNADSVLLNILNGNGKENQYSYSELLNYNNKELSQYHKGRINSDSLYNDLFNNSTIDPNMENKIKELLQCSYDSLFYMTYLDPQGSSVPRNEIAYEDVVYPSQELRILTLFRYWNWVYYYFPYKHLIDEPWDQVLADGIVSMIEARDSVEYHLNLREIIVRIDDAHSFSTTEQFYNKYAKSMVPMLFTVINDSLYIRKVLGLEGATAYKNFARGDQILEIDNKTFDQLNIQYLKYTCGSNKAGKYKNAGAYYKWTQTDSVFVKYIHSGDTILKKIRTLNFDEVSEIFNEMETYDSLWYINEDIIYVDPERWPIESIPKLVEKIYNSKAIIIDLRNYPEWTQYELLPYLPHDTTTPTFRYWKPKPGIPGNFVLKNVECFPERVDSLYQGKIITLVNMFSQSRCEFFGMAMQVAKNNTTIGTTTAGADGDVSSIILPGNVETWFSGIGIEYSDGRQCQQTGIHIDHVLNITHNDWKHHKDPYLHKTVEWLKTELEIDR